MLNNKVTKLLNEQINKEFHSAYLYLDMANYYINLGLDGFANWFKIQAREEQDHAMFFTQFLQNNLFEVTLDAIAKPDLKYASPKDPLVASLEHEKYISASIHAIYDAAFDLRDYRTMEFLNWFVKEQIEEELNADTLVQKFEMVGKDSKGLYLLDKELAKRAYSEPDLDLS